MKWLLLRGLARDQRHWFDLPEKIKGETLCLDLPGFGHEAHHKSPLTISATTDFLRERFLTHAQTGEIWGLVGISLGGMLAMDWTKRYPEDFKKLVLINSSTKDLSPLLQRVSPFAIYCLLRSIFAKTEREREHDILKMVSNLRLHDEKLLSKLTEYAMEPQLSLEAVARQLTAASRFYAPNSLDVQTLVLASMKDRMVDVRCSKALAERFQAQIKFHPTAGHDLPLDDSAWVADRINEFVDPN